MLSYHEQSPFAACIKFWYFASSITFTTRNKSNGIKAVTPFRNRKCLVLACQATKKPFACIIIIVH